MDVVEVTNPQALTVLEVQLLLKRAVESDVLITPYGFDALATDLFNLVTDPRSFLLLGFEEGHFASVVMGYFPNGNMFPYPTITLFYNEGSPELLTATKRKLLEHLAANGYSKALAVNATKHSDKAWSKVFKAPGTTQKRIGSIMMLEVE